MFLPHGGAVAPMSVICISKHADSKSALTCLFGLRSHNVCTSYYCLSGIANIKIVPQIREDAMLTPFNLIKIFLITFNDPLV